MRGEGARVIVNTAPAPAARVRRERAPPQADRRRVHGAPPPASEGVFSLPVPGYAISVAAARGGYLVHGRIVWAELPSRALFVKVGGGG
jgi:hypothetical protein